MSLFRKIINKFSQFRKTFKKLPVDVYIFDEKEEVKLTNLAQLPKNVFINSGNKNNVVKLHKNLISRKVVISFSKDATNSECILEDSLDSVGLDVEVIFLAGDGSKCSIGKGTGMNGAKIWLGNGSECHIGDLCRFSYEVIIRTTDGHTILDCEKKEVLNNQKQPCIIGDHSWIGLRTVINKNVQLAHDTIVGSGSVVTKSFTEPYSVIGGNPAKLIKTGVVHDKRTIYHYELDNNLKYGD